MEESWQLARSQRRGAVWIHRGDSRAVATGPQNFQVGEASELHLHSLWCLFNCMFIWSALGVSYRFGCYNKETQNDSDLNNTEISFLSPVKASGHSPELVEQLHSHQRPRSRPPHFPVSCTCKIHVPSISRYKMAASVPAITCAFQQVGRNEGARSGPTPSL